MIRNYLFLTALGLIAVNSAVMSAGTSTADSTATTTTTNSQAGDYSVSADVAQRIEQAQAARDAMLTPSERAEIDAAEIYYWGRHGGQVIAER